MSAALLERVNLALPWASPEELELRQRLRNALTACGNAAVRARSDTARSLYWIAGEVALHRYARPADAEEIQRLVEVLGDMFAATSRLDRLIGGEG